MAHHAVSCRRQRSSSVDDAPTLLAEARSCVEVAEELDRRAMALGPDSEGRILGIRIAQAWYQRRATELVKELRRACDVPS